MGQAAGCGGRAGVGAAALGAPARLSRRAGPRRRGAAERASRAAGSWLVPRAWSWRVDRERGLLGSPGRDLERRQAARAARLRGGPAAGRLGACGAARRRASGRGSQPARAQEDGASGWTMREQAVVL